MEERNRSYRILKINGLTKKVLLEIDSERKLFKKYSLELFDENASEHRFVQKYNNVDDPEEFIFITIDNEKEGK